MSDNSDRDPTVDVSNEPSNERRNSVEPEQDSDKDNDSNVPSQPTSASVDTPSSLPSSQNGPLRNNAQLDVSSNVSIDTLQHQLQQFRESTAAELDRLQSKVHRLKAKRHREKQRVQELEKKLTEAQMQRQRSRTKSFASAVPLGASNATSDAINGSGTTVTSIGDSMQSTDPAAAAAAAATKLALTDDDAVKKGENGDTAIELHERAEAHEKQTTVHADHKHNNPPELTQKQVWLMVIGLSLGMLVAALDNTIVGTALPTIVKELNGTSDEVSEKGKRGEETQKRETKKNKGKEGNINKFSLLTFVFSPPFSLHTVFLGGYCLSAYFNCVVSFVWSSFGHFRPSQHLSSLSRCGPYRLHSLRCCAVDAVAYLVTRTARTRRWWFDGFGVHHSW
jgi:hypothetical protein